MRKLNFAYFKIQSEERGNIKNFFRTTKRKSKSDAQDMEIETNKDVESYDVGSEDPNKAVAEAMQEEKINEDIALDNVAQENEGAVESREVKTGIFDVLDDSLIDKKNLIDNGNQDSNQDNSESSDSNKEINFDLVDEILQDESMKSLIDDFIAKSADAELYVDLDKSTEKLISELKNSEKAEAEIYKDIFRNLLRDATDGVLKSELAEAIIEKREEALNDGVNPKDDINEYKNLEIYRELEGVNFDKDHFVNSVEREEIVDPKIANALGYDRFDAAMNENNTQDKTVEENKDLKSFEEKSPDEQDRIRKNVVDGKLEAIKTAKRMDEKSKQFFADMKDRMMDGDGNELTKEERRDICDRLAQLCKKVQYIKERGGEVDEKTQEEIKSELHKLHLSNEDEMIEKITQGSSKDVREVKRCMKATVKELDKEIKSEQENIDLKNDTGQTKDLRETKRFMDSEIKKSDKQVYAESSPEGQSVKIGKEKFDDAAKLNTHLSSENNKDKAIEKHADKVFDRKQDIATQRESGGRGR